MKPETMKKIKPKKPTDIDLIIGKRIQLARGSIGMIRVDLAEKIGISHQQLQKYENGRNRITASRLYRISLALDFPVTYFFDVKESEEQVLEKVEMTRDAIELIRLFKSAPEGVRPALKKILKAASRKGGVLVDG